MLRCVSLGSRRGYGRDDDQGRYRDGPSAESSGNSVWFLVKSNTFLKLLKFLQKQVFGYKNQMFLLNKNNDKNRQMCFLLFCCFLSCICLQVVEW